MRLARGIALLGVAYALSGCGASPSDEVQAKLQQFAHAVAARRPAVLCRQILAPSLVAHFAAAGLSCEQTLTTFVDSVQDPTLSISRVTVKGKQASAVVLTAARGQHASLESVQLTNTRAGWRLTSLASPR